MGWRQGRYEAAHGPVAEEASLMTARRAKGTHPSPPRMPASAIANPESQIRNPRVPEPRSRGVALSLGMRVALCLAATTAFASLAHGLVPVIVEEGVGLRPVAQPGPPPLVNVELILDSSAGDWEGVVEQVAVRCREGGPTVRVPLTVAPGAAHTQTVRLPVFSIRQEYRLRLLGPAGEEGERSLLAERVLDVEFPGELLDDPRRSLIDPSAYAAWDEAHSLPAWSGKVRRTLFLACVLSAGAFAATLLIRRRRLRAGVLAAIWVVCCAGIVGLAAFIDFDAGGAVVQSLDPLTSAAATRPVPRLLAVTCRRSVVWEPASDADLVPLYRDREQAARDRTEILTAGDSFSVRIPLNPGEVRIFR